MGDSAWNRIGLGLTLLGAASVLSVAAAYVERKRRYRATLSLRPSILGFDLDHTIARYHLRPFFELIYQGLTAYISQHLPDCPGFAEHFDESWCIKGVVLDFTTGDFVWLCEDGHVSKARHGSGPFLFQNELDKKYGRRPWKHFEELKSSKHSSSFFAFITYFEIPATHICAQLIDHCDATNRSYATFRLFIFSAFNHNFSPEAFRLQRGTYFPAVIADPKKYVMERSDVRRWLEAKRTSGHTLFLLTNSHADYTTLLCRTALGDDWRQLFDAVITGAAKPAFFKSSGKFKHVNAETLEVGDDAESFVCDRSSVFCGGNVAELDDALAEFHLKTTGHHPKHVAYFGDHLIGDVQEVNRHTTWRAVAVAEEMECDADHLPEEQLSLASASRLLLHPREWGSFFHTHHNHNNNHHQHDNRKRSHWHNVIRLNASLVIPDVAWCETIEESDIAHWFEPHNIHLGRSVVQDRLKSRTVAKG